MKTTPVLLLICCAFGRILSKDILGIVESYAEPRISMKMAAIDKEWNDVKITGELDVFPNESQMKVFYDMETLEIFLTDPDNIVLEYHDLVRQIENALRMKPKPMCNALFDVLDYWRDQWRKVFCQAVTLAMSVNVDVDRVGIIYQHEPLMLAVAYDMPKAVQNLIERGANIEAAGRLFTALHLAASTGHTSVCKILLQNHANPNSRGQLLGTPKGTTPLMLAANRGKVGALKVLLEFEADVNIQNDDGATALIFAANYRCEEQFEIVDVLLQNDADMGITDKSGKTAQQQAYWQGQCMSSLISAEKTAQKEKLNSKHKINCLKKNYTQR